MGDASGGNQAAYPTYPAPTDPGTLSGLVYGGRDLDGALRSGAAKVEGERSAVEHFLALFPLPEPASKPAAGG